MANVTAAAIKTIRLFIRDLTIENPKDVPVANGRSPDAPLTGEEASRLIRRVLPHRPFRWKSVKSYIRARLSLAAMRFSRGQNELSPTGCASDVERADRLPELEIPMNMDHDTLILSMELAALAVFVALGIWRLYKARDAHKEGNRNPRYDMRRDGPRLTA
jgi:hypothetical protein